MKLSNAALKQMVKYIGDNILQKAHDDEKYCILDSHIDLMDYLQKLEFYEAFPFNRTKIGIKGDQ